MTHEQIKAVRAVAGIILQAAVEAGERGLIAGHLYAVMMGRLTLDQLNQIMSGMVQAGMLTHYGHIYRATAQAATFKA